MTLEEILKVKGSSVFTITPETTMAKAIEELVQHKIGALVVCRRDLAEGEQIVGIISERDVLRFVAAGKPSLEETPVSEVMTKEVITGSLSEPVEQVMELMTSKRIRHLPVLSGKRLVGIVSIGDVVKAQHDRLAMENQFMKDYIQS